MAGIISFETARKRARAGRVVFWIGLVLVLAMLGMYASPAISLFRRGMIEWPGYLVISFPGGEVDFGPAIVGTLGFLFLHVGRRVSRELVDYSLLRLDALRPAVKEGEPKAAKEYDDYLQLWLNLARGRWIVSLLGWLLTLAVGTALATAAAWLRLQRPDFELREVLFWSGVIGAGLMGVRLVLDWPGPAPKIARPR